MREKGEERMIKKETALHTHKFPNNISIFFIINYYIIMHGLYKFVASK
jgi:hypothetical protein